MRAWTVDADDIRVAEDLDEALLHRTPEIDTFLSLERDDKFIVIGTKGFGKTLLLKAKRILYQREGRATCLPVGNLLDKPIGDKIFGKEAIAFLAGRRSPGRSCGSPPSRWRRSSTSGSSTPSRSRRSSRA